MIGISSNSFLKLAKFGFKNRLKFKYLFSDYKSILACKEINNIYIATLNNSHHNLIIDCIKSGKNVLCEKPFAMNFFEAENIKNELSKSNISFREAIAYRSHLQTKIIELLKINIIGKILNIESSFGFNAGQPKKKSRLFNKELGGGAILDLGCYPLTMSSLVANFNNKDEELIPKIEMVSGKIHKLGVETHAKAKLVFENSITADIFVSLDRNLENSTKIFGSDGKMIIPEPWLPSKNQ